jgi:GntR family transcriptional repressor for pyruvate dehydrogenase complex
MTRQQKSRSDRRSADTALTAPAHQVRSLTVEVRTKLLTEISSGRLAPGQRLPTEQEMMQSMKVSRTVVREAISALKAQGLVVTRQGSGAFVSAAPVPNSFTLDPEALRSLDAVLNMLELRLALETEAAGMASTRADDAGIQSVKDAHAAFEAAVDRGETAADEDFAFHLAIANATGNPNFGEFLKFLGAYVIPRQNLRVWGTTFSGKAEYLAQIKQEHGRIVAAIVDRKPELARSALREHLTRAANRYRHFAVAGQAGGIIPEEEIS